MVSVNLNIAIGSDLRAMREGAGHTQQQIADLFGWSRDTVSKIERGVNGVGFADYLEIIGFLAPSIPDHPALPLYRRLRSAATRR